jgi:hypothetical protein
MNAIAFAASPHVVNVAREFSRTPGGRYNSDGPASGQQFREKLLVPMLQQNDRIVIELDGARGYPSSFLEEAFGGLIREKVLQPNEFWKRLEFKASGPFQIYVDDIRSHVERETRAWSR